MSQDVFARVRELIRQHQYDEARALLRESDDPQATQWLDRLDLAAPRTDRIVHHRGWTYLGIAIAVLVFTVAAVVLVYVLTSDESEDATSDEQLTLDLTTDDPIITTEGTFTGLVDIAVSGTVTSGEDTQADAFYSFAEADGVPLVSGDDAWGLYINEQPAANLILDGQKPVFAPDHSYEFTIRARDERLTFFFVTDSPRAFSGSLTITITPAD